VDNVFTWWIYTYILCGWYIVIVIQHTMYIDTEHRKIKGKTHILYTKFGLHLPDSKIILVSFDPQFYRDESVKSWGISVIRGKSLRTVRSARLRLYHYLFVSQIIYRLWFSGCLLHPCRHQINTLLWRKISFYNLNFILFFLVFVWYLNIYFANY
jgi:hypothetical protein